MKFAALKNQWVLLVLCASCAHQSNQAVKFKTSVVQGKNSKIEAVAKGDSSFITIAGTDGIGRASVSLISGKWPEKTTIRLYLKGLEGLNVSTGTEELDISKFSVSVFDLQGKALEDKYLLSEKGYYEVQLPKNLSYDKIDTMEIQWVDFYR